MTNGINVKIDGVIPNIPGQSYSYFMTEWVVIPCNTPRDMVAAVVDKMLADKGLVRVSGAAGIHPQLGQITIDALHQNDCDDRGEVASSKAFDEFSKSMSLPTLAEKAAATWGDL